MSTLHTLNKSGRGHSSLELCLASMKKGDALLLLEDAVYLLLNPAATESLTSQLTVENASANRVFALSEDLAARGISARIPPAVAVVTYREFVALCLEHDRVVNWV